MSIRKREVWTVSIYTLILRKNREHNLRFKLIDIKTSLADLKHVFRVKEEFTMKFEQRFSRWE